MSPNGEGWLESDAEIFDGIVMLRPSFRLSENWRLNPAFSVGAGDSDLTWELHPQLQYAVREGLHLRVGNRRLYYDYTNDRDVEFDGSLHGFTVGLGARF